MPLVLRHKKSGERFRILNEWSQSIQEGSPLTICLDRVRRGRAVQERTANVIFNREEFALESAHIDAMEQEESLRARERLCLKCHPHLVIPRIFLGKEAKPTSVIDDKDWIDKESERLLRLANEYLNSQKSNILSILRFDLRNLLDIIDKRRGKYEQKQIESPV